MKNITITKKWENVPQRDRDTVYISLKDKFKDQVVTPAMISLNNSIELLALFRKLGHRILSAAASGEVKFANRLRQLVSFGKYVLMMRKHHGATTTVKYLKASQLAIQRAIAKSPAKSLRDLEPDLPLPRLTTSGLPRYIPLRDRRLILSGKSAFTVRWWLTLYSVYRVISIPGKMKLGTIVDPFTGSPEKLVEISMNLSSLTSRFKKDWPKFHVKEPEMLLLQTSSSTGRPAWTGWLFDGAFMPPHIADPFKRFCIKMKFDSFLMNFEFTQSLIKFPFMQDLESYWEGVTPSRHDVYGQLVTKDEAAGKVRVFAMVDVWTQSLLKPLHNAIFSILKSLPNDGTFNQEASVLRCFEKAKIAKKSFGYDLSAATDRLPIDLQVSVLSSLIGREPALLWKEILVGRAYLAPVDDRSPKDIPSYYYKVGQPMGAYSSWGMLALTHHLIVQLAALNAGKLFPGEWYSNYELLGDDIVLFDESVAAAYLSLMKDLGVPINLSKSVVARNNCFEFAKVTGLNGHVVAAISWKQFISQNSLMGRVNICYKLWQRIKPAQFVKWFVRVNRKSKYDVGDRNYALLALFSMIVKAKGYPLSELLKVIYNPKELGVKKYKHLLWNVRTNYIERLISMWTKGKSASLSPLTGIWNNEEPWVHLAVWQPTAVWKYKHADLDAIRISFCTKLVTQMIPNRDIKELCTISFDPLWTEEQQMINCCFLLVYHFVTPKLDRLWAEASESEVTMDSSLEQLVELRESWDQFMQFLLIPETPLKKPIKEGDKVENPRLRVLLDILKSWRRRPAWTVDALKNFKF